MVANARESLIVAMDFLSSSSSEDSEEDKIIEYIKKYDKQEVPKVKNYISETVHYYSDKLFKSHFRLNRSTVSTIIEDFQKSSYFPVEGYHGGCAAVDAETHVLAFLWFAGNKCSIRDVADRFGIGITTYYRIHGRVVRYLNNLASTVISLPNDKVAIANEFQTISGFPGIIGCIDGTTIPIITPAHKIKSTYCNRHDTPSLVLQGICDHSKKFIDVCTGIPAKVHDSRVLKLSDIYNYLPQYCGNNYHLLGDSAYPIREWLITPYRDYGNLTNKQVMFNKKLSKCRVLIENTFGLLKGRFRQLTLVHMKTVHKISSFVLACCVLHNICIENNDLFEEMEIIDDNNKEQNTSKDNDSEQRKLGEEKRHRLLTQIT